MLGDECLQSPHAHTHTHTVSKDVERVLAVSLCVGGFSLRFRSLGPRGTHTIYPGFVTGKPSHVYVQHRPLVAENQRSDFD